MLSIEKAKCLALHRLVAHCGEETLLQKMQRIVVETSQSDGFVTVRFVTPEADDELFPFTVCIDCETGDSLTFDQP